MPVPSLHPLNMSFSVHYVCLSLLMSLRAHGDRGSTKADEEMDMDIDVNSGW